MERNLVQIARIRLREVVPGDVVNRLADEQRGWFAVGLVEELFDGDLAVSNSDRTKTFSAGPFDIVGVQMLKPLDIPADEPIGPVVETDRTSQDAADEAEAKEQEQPQPEPAAAPVEPTPDPSRVAEVSRAKEALAARISRG